MDRAAVAFVEILNGPKAAGLRVQQPRTFDLTRALEATHVERRRRWRGVSWNSASWRLLVSIRVSNQWRLVFRWGGSRGEAEGIHLDDHSYR